MRTDKLVALAGLENVVVVVKGRGVGGTQRKCSRS